MASGQLMIDVQGYELTAEDRECLSQESVAGIIYFERNFASLEQITDLSEAIRAVRPDLLIAVDQEGGRIQRFKKGCTRLPSLHQLGEYYDVAPQEALALAGHLGWLMASEMRALGCDFSFAPVLDLNRGVSAVIGDRSFSRSPEVVSLLGAAYIQGLHEAGSIAVGKHYPGHGAVAADSHIAVPFDRRPMSEIEEDQAPFAALIAKGLDAIMPAHIVFEAVDNLPVGFSHRWCQQILRGQLGFDGCLISDDLSMAGAVMVGSYRDRVVASIEAGIDLMLVCNNRPAVLELLEDVPEQAVGSSARIQRLRGRGPASWTSLEKSPRRAIALAALEAASMSEA